MVDRTNTLNIPGLPQARQPRAVVRLNGTRIDAWVSWEVTTNTYYEADTFRVSFAVSALPHAYNSSWFYVQTSIAVEILASPDDPDKPSGDGVALLSLIYGRADEIELDPIAGVLTLTGRDLTALFIDNKVTDTYQAKKASEIAVLLALSQFLTPVVTPTSGDVGTYYKHEQLRMHADRSQWDLLAYLAREEGFVCYVTGNELHFEPDAPTTLDRYVMQCEVPASIAAGGPPIGSVQEMTLSRTLTVARGVNVTVRSASVKTKTPVVQSYPGTLKAIQAGKSALSGGVQQYFFTAPAGTTSIKCQQIAQSRYHEIVSHELKVRARLPADNILTPKTRITVRGTGTPADGDYFPRSITRMMSMDEGYTMTVEAQNLNPNTVATS